ncbi:hypothetical protein CUMW_046250 [Citrus unshiu]|nr:hypothetical protein CUMW_046250 [Citrus unshiu]
MPIGGWIGNLLEENGVSLKRVTKSLQNFFEWRNRSPIRIGNISSLERKKSCEDKEYLVQAMKIKNF